MQPNLWYSTASWDVGGEHLAAWVSFLQDIGCVQVNLTHHLSGTAEIELLRALQTDLSWSIHLSSKSLGATPLTDFTDIAQQLHHVRELLVVSGNPKPDRTSLTLLQELSGLSFPIPLAVAAAPNDAPELLEQKLQHSQVNHVYLQLAEPQFWNPLLAQVRSIRPAIQISACWLPPTKSNWSTLAKFPWKGSVLTLEWKNSHEYAKRCAQHQLDWMRQHGVTPLIEPRRITKDLLETVQGYAFRDKS
jgi:hypothetical protein